MNSKMSRGMPILLLCSLTISLKSTRSWQVLAGSGVSNHRQTDIVVAHSQLANVWWRKRRLTERRSLLSPRLAKTTKVTSNIGTRRLTLTGLHIDGRPRTSAVVSMTLPSFANTFSPGTQTLLHVASTEFNFLTKLCNLLESNKQLQIFHTSLR